MPNMSYVRFENTYRDMLDCREAMDKPDEELSSSEQGYRRRLIALCREIADEYSEPETEEL